MIPLLLVLLTATPRAEPSVEVLQSSASRTVIGLHVPQPEWRDVNVGGETHSAILLPGAVTGSRPGEPDIPVYRFAIALPPNCRPMVRLQTDQRISFRDVHIPPAPREALLPRARGSGSGPGLLQTSSVPVQEPYPERRARVIRTGRIRSLDIAYIEVCPVEYYPSKHLLFLDQTLLVTIETASDQALSSVRRQAAEARDPMKPVLSRLVVNYDEAMAWRQGPPVEVPHTVRAWEPPYPSVKLLIDHEGYYTVTGQELRDAGVMIESINPVTLQLLVGGFEVPINLVGMDDGTLDANDRLEFIGQPVYREDPGYRVAHVGGRFTETNVYWLTWGYQEGERLGTRQVEQPSGGTQAEYFRWVAHLEEDLNPFIPDDAAISGDRYGEEWFWGPPLTPTDGEVDYAFTLQGVASVPDPIQIRASLRGYTHPHFNYDPHHHAIVYLNDVQVTHLLWYANEEKFYDSREDPWYDPDLWPNDGAINEGENHFSVEITGDTEYEWFDGAYTDWFEIDYWKSYHAWNDSLAFSSPQQSGPGTYRYSVSGFSDSSLILLDLTHNEVLYGFEVVQQGGGSEWVLQFKDGTIDSTLYLALAPDAVQTVAEIQEEVPSDLQGSQGAEFVIIAHEELREQAERLSQGRAFHDTVVNAMTVDVQDIYDEYSYGVFDPRSIRDFLMDGYVNWVTPPTFTLLFGDATWDYKQNSPTSDPTHRNFVPSYGNPARDDFFANVDDQGGADSLLPDLFIARIPVENADTAATVVDKILSYEQGEWDPGSWRENVLCIAGGYIDPDGYDSRGYFEQQCSNLLQDFVEPEPAHYNAILSKRPTGLHFENEYETTEDESLQVLFNDVGIVHATYIGHGASWTWETMFWKDDVENDLHNTGMLPMVNSMTCHTGRFANPEIDSFGEIWIWQPHGAMGFWGTTAWGFTTPDYIMARKQFEVIFQEEERAPVVALLASKLDPAIVPYLDDPMVSPLLYVWIGDPLVPLALGERPDWVLEEGDVQLSPLPVIAGDTLMVAVTVRNGGIDPGPSTSLRLFDGNPDSGAVVLVDLSVPGLAEEESVTVGWAFVVEGEEDQRSVHAWVNPDTSEQESYRGNNRSWAEYTVDLPVPDLVTHDSLLSITPLSPEVLDSVLSVSLTMANQGTGPAGAFRVLLVDTALATGDVHELADQEVPGLERGASLSIDASWVIDDGDTGDHTVTAFVDWRDEVDELDESNNRAFTALHIATRAELMAHPFMLSNDQPPEGDSLLLTGRWTNSGEAAAGAFRSAIFHGYPDSTTSQLLAEMVVDSLGGGMSDTLSCAWSTVGQVGMHTFYLQVDTDDVVPELDETNNMTVREIQVVTGPDLVVSDVSLEPIAPVEGDSSSMSICIRNGGMVATDSFTVALTLDGSLVDSWRLRLAEMSETTVFHEWVWEQGASSGDHEFVITADQGDEIAETNETNNSVDLAVYVLTLPDLAVVMTSSHEEAVDGEPIVLHTAITNLGEAPAHTVRVLWEQRIGSDATWEPFDSTYLPTLEGSASSAESVEVTAHTGLMGFKVSVGTPVEEQGLENNADSCVVMVRERYPPDLRLLAMRLDADTVTVGERAKAVLEISNTGELTPDSSWVSLHLVSDDSLVGTWPVEPMDPGDTTGVHLAWVVPHGQTIWQMIVGCSPPDTLTADNTVVDTLFGLWPAELEAVDNQIVSIPHCPLEGDTVTVSLTVRNSGEQAAPLYSVALFRGNPSPGQIETAELLDTVTPEDGLAPGANEDLLMRFVAPELPGVHDIFVWIDAAQLIDETDETNNLVGAQIEVLARGFDMDKVMPIPSPAPGRTRFFVRTTHEADVEIKIYAVSGRLVHVLGPMSVVPERSQAIDWRCEDLDGDRVANGVYFYHVDSRSRRTDETAHFEGKILVAR